MQLVAWLSSMLAALDGAGAPVAPAVSERAPVVLVHGIHASSRDMRRMACYFRAQGREVFTPDLSPAGGQVRLDLLAQQLAAFTELHLHGRKFDLVGFSMGGLVSRYYVQRLGGLQRVEHFVTIAAPHQGTALANLHFGDGGRQMRPRSDFLRELARDSDRLRDVKFTSFYTPLDLVIVPARNSEMPQANNVRLWAAMHPSLILERRCIRAVAKALKS
jgi:triacylglycerol lipase